MCAGVPTGRGIPDYRGPSGLWKTKSPVDARSSWALPRQGVELEKTGSLLMLVTRNIDGLHVKAGIRNP
jgi:NAD-dependent SIR2 family protein deacetylase